MRARESPLHALSDLKEFSLECFNASYFLEKSLDHDLEMLNSRVARN